jgi:DNA-binding response OmpR family regulator
VIDTANRTVTVEDKQIDLTTAEFDLLWLLAKSAGKAIPRDDLYQELHGVRYDGLDRSIDLRVSRLRKKLGDDPIHPQRIKSIRSVGYLLATQS